MARKGSPRPIKEREPSVSIKSLLFFYSSTAAESFSLIRSKGRVHYYYNDWRRHHLLVLRDSSTGFSSRTSLVLPLLTVVSSGLIYDETCGDPIKV